MIRILVVGWSTGRMTCRLLVELMQKLKFKAPVDAALCDNDVVKFL